MSVLARSRSGVVWPNAERLLSAKRRGKADDVPLTRDKGRFHFSVAH